MTAEVGVMNRLGVALAADSAVTIGPSAGKIYTSANKLFQLTKKDPIGIMVYGNSNFLRVPWETIIKEYRVHLGKNFPQLEDYVKDFIRFLKSRNSFFPAEDQKSFVYLAANDFFEFIRKQFENILEKRFEETDKLQEIEIKRLFTKLVNDELIKTKESPKLDELPKNFAETLKNKYRSVIANAKKEIFEHLPISQLTERRLIELICELLTSRRMEDGGFSGIVITGFGHKEHFPVLVEIFMAGIAAGHPLHSQLGSVNIAKDAEAIVIPFAQKEMVHTFMEGIDPDLRSMIEQSTVELFRKVADTILIEVKNKYHRYGTTLTKRVDKSLKKLLMNLNKYWDEMRRQEYSGPVMEMVASLPKDELGAMAESLVNLTKFKRRVSKQHETVGGPIDVAIITKGDGFVWVKRKHYFQPELNPQFFDRYT